MICTLIFISVCLVIFALILNTERGLICSFFFFVGFKLRSMDSNARENWDAKAEFKKPSNDAANRKYRRRSPVGGSSSSSDGQFLI